MDDFRFEGIKRKRTQTCRRPKAEVQSQERASLEDAGNISSDENAIDANPKRKVFNLNQCASVPSTTRAEGEYPSNKIAQMEDGRYNNNTSHSNGDANEQAHGDLNHEQHKKSKVDADGGGGNEKKLKKVKLKLGGVTRTIQAKSNLTSVSSSDAPRPRPKLILQDNSDEEGKKIGGGLLQGIPWKDFSRGGFSIGRENSMAGKKQGQGQGGDKQSRKSKRLPKKQQRVLDEGDFDEEEDDEIRFLEKLKTVKVAAAASSRDIEEDLSKKQNHRGVSRVSKGKYENSESGKKSSSVSVDDTNYEEVSDHHQEKEGKAPDSPTFETKRETSLTSRQRALLSGRDSASAATQTEFPNGLPPAAPRKQKEKLTEVEQQLKKAEAAERRRIQNEKAARESEAEAIRKILGQDSSRKKREDKLKKRQEELQQEKATNAKTLAPNTIRTVIGPTGTVVAFAQDIGLPHIFHPKPTCYPPPREKCAGPSCNNAYKYRDSKSKLPLCSLQCYKAIHHT